MSATTIIFTIVVIEVFVLLDIPSCAPDDRNLRIDVETWERGRYLILSYVRTYVRTYVEHGSVHNRALPAAIENYLASPGILLYSRRVAASLNRCIPLRGTAERATRIIYSSSSNRGRDASALDKSPSSRSWSVRMMKRRKRISIKN